MADDDGLLTRYIEVCEGEAGEINPPAGTTGAECNPGETDAESEAGTERESNTSAPTTVPQIKAIIIKRMKYNICFMVPHHQFKSYMFIYIK